MRQGLGIALLVLGVLAGMSAASMAMRAEAQRLPPAERVGQAIGGSLCSLTPIVSGFFLIRSGGKQTSAEIHAAGRNRTTMTSTANMTTGRVGPGDAGGGGRPEMKSRRSFEAGEWVLRMR